MAPASLLPARPSATPSRLERAEKATVACFLIPCAVFLALFFFLPVAGFLLRGVFDPSFTLKHYRTALTEGIYLTIFWRTLAISGATTFCCLALGYPVAYAIAQASGRMRALALALVLIPFWTSILVRVFAWIALLGRNGVINSALMALGITQSPVPMLYNTFAVLIGMTHVMLPYMILPCYAVMRNLPLELTAAAANLGATPVQAFRRIFMPLSAPGAAAGALLVFIVSGGFFVTPALMGGSSGMLVSQLIEQEVANATDWSFAAALSGLLLTVTMALYVVYDRLVPLEDEAPT